MSIESEKEIQQLKNRFRDLADKSYTQNVFTFSGFLGLSEQDVFWQMEGDLKYVPYGLWGGTDQTDRKVLRFGSREELGYEEPYPIVCVHIRPLSEKFADDFSHRDFLGALMSLGIDRGTLGDIRVGGREGYLFCLDSIAEYICDNLDQVRHTHVKCEIVDVMKELPEDVPEELEVLVSSERIDAVAAKVYKRSRSDMLNLFRAGKVYVGGRLCENNSRLLKAGDVVNVRGFGKFLYGGPKYETKKGKLSVQTLLYR